MEVCETSREPQAPPTPPPPPPPTGRSHTCNQNQRQHHQLSKREGERQVEDEDEIHHFSHHHPLKLSEVRYLDDDVYCYACEKRCLGWIYSCTLCNQFLHKSCFNLHRQIQLPLHPSHSLVLSPRTTIDMSYCDACLQLCKGFSYTCCLCDFKLHIQCADLIPKVKYEGHLHPLLLEQNIGDDFFSTNPNDSLSYTVLCRECEFNVHLPTFTTSNEYDEHPLVLEKIMTEDYHLMHKFYCDVCYKELNPHLPVYHCETCNFIADIGCVLPEIGKSSVAEWKREELNSKKDYINTDLASDTGTAEAEKKKKFSLNDIRKSFTEDENKELNTILEARKKEVLREGMDLFSSLEENYHSFMKSLESGARLHYPDEQLWDKEVAIDAGLGDYIVTENLSPILEELIDKYGHIGANSGLNSRVMIFFLAMLCQTLFSMSNTLTIDIHENLLANWWDNFKVLKLAGFSVEFATDHLKRASRAYYDIRVKGDIISEISKSKAKFEIQKAKLKALERIEKLLISEKIPKSSGLVSSLRDASRLKGKYVGDGILENENELPTITSNKLSQDSLWDKSVESSFKELIGNWSHLEELGAGKTRLKEMKQKNVYLKSKVESAHTSLSSSMLNDVSKADYVGLSPKHEEPIRREDIQKYSETIIHNKLEKLKTLSPELSTKEEDPNKPEHVLLKGYVGSPSEEEKVRIQQHSKETSIAVRAKSQFRNKLKISYPKGIMKKGKVPNTSELSEHNIEDSAHVKKMIIKLNMDISHDKEMQKAMKLVIGFPGVESVSMDKKDKKMTVIGDFDPVDVLNKLRKTVGNVQILSVAQATKEPKRTEETKKDSVAVSELVEAYRAHNTVPVPCYYVNSVGDPNDCVIC